MALLSAVVNGVEFTHQQIGIKLYGFDVPGITKIDWGCDTDTTMGYGVSPNPLSIGFGANKYSCTIEAYRSYIESVTNSVGPLVAAGGTLIVTFYRTAQSILQTDLVYQIDIRGLKNPKNSSSEGADLHKISLEAITMNVRRNGISIGYQGGSATLSLIGATGSAAGVLF